MTSEIDLSTRRRVLTAVLAGTIEEPSSRLPTAPEYVLYTFAKSVIRYVGGDTAQLSPSREILEPNTHKVVVAQLEAHGEALEPLIRETILQLTEPKTVDPGGPSHNYTTCELYEIFRGRNQGVGFGIRPLFCMERTFSPEYAWITRARKETIPSFTDAQKRDLEGIAKKLREVWTKDSKTG